MSEPVDCLKWARDRANPNCGKCHGSGLRNRTRLCSCVTPGIEREMRDLDERVRQAKESANG